MKLINSNKSSSNIIAGILVIAVFCILLALCMGYGGYNNYRLDRGQSYLLVGSDYYLPNYNQGDKKNVPVPECLYLGKFDVGAGEVKVYDSLFIDTYQFDIVTDFSQFVQSGSITIMTSGGYHPDGDNCVSRLKIRQQKEGIIYWITLVTDGVALDELTLLGQEDPVWDYYLYTFGELFEESGDNINTLDANDLKVDFMYLDANHIPSCTKTLDKEVKLSLCLCLTGCGQPDQDFTEILVHKKFCFRSPQLPKNFIAS